MYKSSPVRIIKSLNAKEFKELGELIHSPFFNKNENVKKLYEYLKKYYPDFKQDDVEKEKIFASLFPKAEYSDGFMRSLIYNFSGLCQQYLVHANLKNSGPKGMLMLLDELNNRRLEKEFRESLSGTLKQIEKLNPEDSYFSYYKYLYQVSVNDFINWSRYGTKNITDNIDLEVFKESKYILDYALTIALSNYRKYLFIKEFEKFEYSSEFLETAVKYISVTPAEFKDSLSVMLHMNEVLLLKTKSDKYYRVLKDMLFNKLKSQDERYSLVNILHGYCYNRVYEGEKKYSGEIFRLYKASVDGGFYKSTKDLHFDAILFTNIVHSAIKSGFLEWAEEFIKKYNHELPEDDRFFVNNFLEAKIFYEKKEHIKALEKLEGIKNIRHVQYKVASRNLMLILYYELGYYDKAELFHASYRQFISKTEKLFSPQRYRRYTEFLKLFSAMLKITAHKDELKFRNKYYKQLISVSKILEDDTNIMERSWLLEKVKQHLVLAG